MADTGQVVQQGAGFTVPELPIHGDPVFEANTLAPLIFNCWYVISLTRDVDRTLRSIKVLGQPLVFYRTEDGRPIVLDDRCAHRRFPLSKGRLKGDAVECGYHGFTYAETGQCLWAPGLPLGDNGRGLGFGVRNYPCAERGPWLWVWMGEPDKASPDDIPMPSMGGDPRSTVFGYKFNPSNYMMIIENLLDLSHAEFLHGGGKLDQLTITPSEIPAPADGVAWKKQFDRTATGEIAAICGEDPQRQVRFEETTTQYGPSLTFGVQRRMPLPGDPPTKPELFEIAHAVTPVDARNTHQFFTMSMSAPFVLDPEIVGARTADVVFEQDVEAVGAMQANVEEDDRPGRVEVNMGYDKFGLKMRAILQDMKRREARVA